MSSEYSEVWSPRVERRSQLPHRSMATSLSTWRDQTSPYTDDVNYYIEGKSRSVRSCHRMTISTEVPYLSFVWSDSLKQFVCASTVSNQTLGSVRL